MPLLTITGSTEVIYECNSCGSLKKAESAFQADRPNGF